MARKRREIGSLQWISGPRVQGKPKEYADTLWYVSGAGSWGGRWGAHNFQRLQDLSQGNSLVIHFSYYNPDTQEWRLSRPQRIVNGDMSASAFTAFKASYEDDGYEIVEVLYSYI